MLKNLVKKFKTHSLDDDSTPTASSQEICQNSKIRITRNSKTPRQMDLRTINPYQATMTPSPTAIKNCPLCITTKHDVADFERDSGTESDEELEQIETNSTHSVPISQTSDYYASQQSLSASCRSSHCGSPLIGGGFSDQECYSWDAGSTTIVDGDSSFLTPLELPNHHYHTRQQMKRFLKQHQAMRTPSQNGLVFNEDCEKIGLATMIDQQAMTPTAFVPVRRLRSDPSRKVPSVAEGDEPSEDLDNLVKGTSILPDEDDATRGRSSSLTGSEKRKWSQVRNSNSLCCFSGTIQGENRNGTNFLDDAVTNDSVVVKNRPLLTAARKTPVKLLIPLEKCSSEKFPSMSCEEFLTSTKISPRKKCKHDDLEHEPELPSEEQKICSFGGRPSLNFYKMREKLVKPSKKKIQHYNSFVSQSKSKFIASSNGYQLRSSRNDCVFRPVYQPTPVTLGSSDSTPNLHIGPFSFAVANTVGVV